MRNFYLSLLGLLLYTVNGKAQTANQYTFSTVNSASLATEKNGNAVDMTAGTTQLIAASQDNVTSVLTNIGFNFTFFGTVYTNFTASSNGGIRLGGAIANNAYGTAFPIAGQPILAPYLGDFETNTTGKVHYKLIGTYPNRTLVIEYLNLRINFNSTTADATFQARLYEQTNVIEYVYGSMSVGSVSTTGSTAGPARTTVIGFSNNTGNNNQFSVNQGTYATSTTATAITNTNAATGAITGLTSTANGSRRSFTFTPTLSYKSQYLSMNTGAATWCAGETRTITVTVKNIGTATWNSTGANPVNIGVKWNTNGANWTDYYIRTSALNLAPGATGTFSFPLTASNNTGTGYTTVLAAGTNNISFDIVQEGIAWFGSNAGGTGPGNIVYASAAATIVALPAAPTASSTQAFCTNANPTVANLAATGTTIKWYSTPTGGTPLLTTAALVNGTHYYASQTNASGCESSARLDVTAVVNPNSGLSLASASGTDNQALCINTAITNIVYSVTAGTGATVTGLPAGVNGNYNSGSQTYTLAGTPTVSGTFNYSVSSTGPCGNMTMIGTITVTANGNITLSSAAGTNNQAVCIATPITNITYSIGGTATSASLTAGAFPPGITGSFAAGVFSITGTPSATGIYNYTIESSGSSCVNTSVSGSITVNEDAVITFSSAAGTDAQILCALAPFSDITYTVSGFGATGATVSGLPSGVSGVFNAGVFTISGSPSASGTFNYTVTTTGPCGNVSLSGSITANNNGTVTLSSAAGTNAQSVCLNNAITNITYAIDPSATNASITSGALPAGVSGTFAGGTFTISGTPTVSGVFNYTVEASGSPCSNFSANGSITVNENATISLSSTTGTDAQIICIGNSITSISYAIGGFGTTGVNITGLPAGVSGNLAGNVFTVNGTPITPGNYSYTITAAGPCATPSLTGTITVRANSTISRTSAAATTAQTVCENTSITNITYSVGGSGTGANVSGLPAGVTGSFNAGSFTISGSPTATGSFNYSVTTTGPCVNATLTGTITVNANATITLTSAPATNSQTLCIATPITPITYGIGGGGTGATVTGLPAGVTGAYNSGTRVYTISGTPTVAGTFNYTITTTGPCAKPTATGSITVTANATITRTSTAATAAQTVCINNTIANITYAIAGSGTGATVTGLPAGVSFTVSGLILTISGTPTVSGAFNYTVTTTGPCINPSATGTITVNADATIALTSAAATTAQTKCINNAITNITYNIGGGGTGATVTGLPAGVTGNFNSTTRIYTVSGTPTVAGIFNYTVTSSGPCVKPALSGTITVIANSTIILSSASGTNVQTTCTNSAIINISYTIGGSGTGATVSNLPAGVNGNFSAGSFLISGTPTAAGTYNYVVTTTGPCANPSLSGTITVNAQPSGTLVATENSGTANDNTICPASNVTFTATAGFGSYIFKVNGTTVQSGTSNVFNSSTLTNGATVTADVANGANCGATFGPIIITVNPLPVAGLSADKTSICAGETITFTASGGVSYAFKVNGATVQSGSSNIYATNTLSNGNSVTVTVTNSGSCVSTSAPIVINVAALPAGTWTASSTSVCTGNNVTFTATAGFSNYNFNVNGVSLQSSSVNTFNSTTLTNPSVVTVELTNAAGCKATLNAIVITVNDEPVGNLTATENSGVINDNSICSGSPVSFSATAGFANYQFSVNGITQQDNGSNFYTSSTLANNDVVSVVVTNGSTCTATFNSISITVLPVPAGILSANATNICPGESITLTATAGFDNYNFMVNGVTAQNGSANVFSSTNFVNGDIVSVDVSSAAPCTATFNDVTITVSSLPSGALTITENSGVAANDGVICTDATVVFTAPAGFSNYNFLLNNATIQNGIANTYSTSILNNGDVVSVAVSNSGDCIGLLTASAVTVNTYPAVAPVTGINNLCVNESITLSNATAGGVWSSNNSSLATVNSAGVVTALSSGNVIISYDVTNAGNCTSTASLSITINAVPVVAPITGNSNLCTGSSAQYSSATQGGTWSSSNTSIATVSTSGVVTGISNGSVVISYTVSNSNNCTTVATIAIAVQAVPVLNPITGSVNVCLGNSSQLLNDTDGGVWSSSNPSVAAVDAGTGLVTSVSPGSATISYTVTDGNNCSTTESVAINIYALPVPTLAGPNPICPNSTGVYTTELGQTNYIWNFTGGTLVSGGSSTDNTITIAWDQPGIKSITVNYTNAQGCPGASSATVTTTTGTPPVLTGPSPVCLNGSELYTTDANQSDYIWSVTGGTITSGGTTTDNTATITWNNSGTGTVSVNYSDINGCTAVSPTVLSVVVRPLPSGSIAGTTVVCQNSMEPTLTLSGSNGTAPYSFTYTINGGANQVVTTSTGNSVTLPVPTGNAGNYVYALVSVQDGNGCFAALNASASVTVNELPGATISGDAAVCQNTSAIVTFTATNGTAPFSFGYNINGGATQIVSAASGNSVTVPAATGINGTFVYNLVSVTDANCSQAQTGLATIEVAASPTAVISGTASVCVNSASPVITFTGSNGTAPYTFTYTLNGGASQVIISSGNTATITVPTTAAGTYAYTLVSVADDGAAACSQPQTGGATITVNNFSDGGTTASDAVVCSGINSGTITLSAQDGTIIRWELSTNGGSSWTPVANTTATFVYSNITLTTLYHAIVQNGSCPPAASSVTTITVTEPSVGGIVSSNATVCTGANSGTLTATGQVGNIIRWESSVNGGTSWTPIANTTAIQNYLNLTQTTLYRVIVANAPCVSVASAAVTITVSSLPTATVSGTASECQNAASPVVTFTGANGTAPYTFTYKINGGANQTVVSSGNTVTVAAPTTAAGSFVYSLVSVQGSGSPACSQAQTGSVTIIINALPATFTITPASAGICQGAVQPLSAAAATPNAGSLTFSSGNVNLAIPEGNRASTIAVSGIPAGAIINSVSVNFNITHGYDEDLVINLRAPNANTLNLVNQRGAGGDNFTNTTINSLSTNPVNAGTAPFNGTYRADAANNVGTPNSNVTTFAGLYSTPNGNWVLNAEDVIDCHGGFIACLFGGGTYYTGVLNSWSITFNYTQPNSPVNSVWSPIASLYTDAGGTVPYAGQSISTVYAQPATNTTYTATATSAAGCTASKTVAVTVSPTPVATISADYCVVPGKVRLTATSIPAATSYIWSNGATTAFIDVDIAGSFEVTVFAGGVCPGTAIIEVARELVENGDFENGNTGFITPPLGPNQYQYIADGPATNELNPEGLYGIGPDAHTYHSNFWGHDHTTGSGNFMIINGFPNGNPQPIVWQETVSVLPSTNYYFSAWGISVNNAGPFAQLQFNVNGAQVGTVATLPAGVNNNSNNGWVRFYGTWTSGPTTTTAVISITDLQSAPNGNDFGLDDISFATLSTFITLESAVGTNAQTVCVNSALTNIVYSVGNGSPTGPNVTGLPAGVTSSYAGNILTISGTPTIPGNYSYTITTTGTCLPTSATGTITVQGQGIALTSGTATVSACTGSPVSVGYTLSGTATGAVFSGLPAGVTGSVSGTSVIISGSPSVAGNYPYTITTTGTCAAATASGTIVAQQQSVTLTAGNTNQSVCINTAISNIQYSTGGTATGATITGLPAGVSGIFNNGLVFISGSPTVAGTFNYSITTTGTCTAATVTGSITVTPAASLVLFSAAGTNAQISCRNTAITNIVYTINGGTSATVSGLPAGITGSYNAGQFTISGSSNTLGTFSYIVSSTGGCGTATASGTITIQAQAISLTSGTASPAACINVAIANIVYTLGGTATGATVSGLPSGIGFTIAGNQLTISGTATIAGNYPYTILTTGACSGATASGTITVQPGASGGTLASAAICSGGNGSLTVTGYTGNVVRWELSTDNGTTWSPITNTTITHTYSNVTDPTLYRAVLNNGCGIAYSTVAAIAIRNYWTGNTSTDWHTPGNWSDNQVPSMFCADVHVKGSRPNQPTLGSGVAAIENLRVYTGAIVTIDNAVLKIAGSIFNNGSVLASNGTVEFNGSVAQTIAAATFQNNALGNLVINNSSVGGLTLTGSLDIYRSVTFTGTGRKFSTGGLLTFKSTATETAWLGNVTGNSITGDATVERYIATGTGNAPNHGKSWQLLAVPTTGQTIKQAWQEGANTVNGNPAPGYGTMLTSNVPNAATQPTPGFDVFTAAGPSIKTFVSATNSYVSPSSTTNQLYDQKGYFILVRGDRSVTAYNQAANNTVLRSKGTLFTPDNLPAATTVQSGSFESVGNPYASALDVRNIGKSGGVDEFFYVWDPRLGGTNNLGGYQTLFKSGANYFAMPGGGSYGPGVNNFIQSGQAFMVQTTSSAGSVSFTESAKVSGSALLFRDNQSPSLATSLKTNLYSLANNSITLADGALNMFGDDYSTQADGLDARKLPNSGENISIKSNNSLFSIERRGHIMGRDTIFLNLANTRAQQYRLEFDAALGIDVEGYIEDMFLNTKTPLANQGITTIDFSIANIPGSYAADRFRIVFMKLLVLPVTYTTFTAVEHSKKVSLSWTTENELNIKNYVVERSVNGRDFAALSAEIAASNTGSQARYAMIDPLPVNGFNYYRVRSTDVENKKRFTNVIPVFIEAQKSDIAIYPNPIVNGVINLQLINQPAGEYDIKLFNKVGQVILSQKATHAEGSSTIKINWNFQLARGMYLLEVVQPGGHKKVIKVLY